MAAFDDDLVSETGLGKRGSNVEENCDTLIKKTDINKNQLLSLKLDCKITRVEVKSVQILPERIDSAEDV